MKRLPADELRRQLKYNPITGKFIWLQNKTRVNFGDDAGCLCGNGYVLIRVCGTKHAAHRLAWLYMTGDWPKGQIDHINGVRGDNRWANLRHVTGAENSRNAKRRVDNASGITGVCWDIEAGRWASHISDNGRFIKLGRRDDFFEACCLRKSAETRLGFHPNHGRDAA